MTRSPRPAACVSCAAPLRTYGEDAPGTRVHAGRGMCSPCWKQDRYGSRPRPPRPPGPCSKCGRGWDVVSYGTQGMCSGCHSTQKYRDTHEPVRQPMPATCRGCDRTLRRGGTPKAPGTVAFAGNGLCGSCWHAARRGAGAAVPRVTPTECSGCHRPMRTKSQAEPGCVIHRTRGLCNDCYTTAAAQERALLAYVLGGAS